LLFFYFLFFKHSQVINNNIFFSTKSAVYKNFRLYKKFEDIYTIIDENSFIKVNDYDCLLITKNRQKKFEGLIRDAIKYKTHYYLIVYHNKKNKICFVPQN